MAFKLVQRNSVAVQIEGELTGEGGAPEAFGFTLHCRRLGTQALQAALKDKERSVADFMAEVAEGWDGVADSAGAPLAYGAAALQSLLDIPGLAQLAFTAYLEQQGARAKN